MWSETSSSTEQDFRSRILMPRAHVRLSAGRSEMNDELQALCFMAGANSIFYGEKLLTTGNPDTARDRRLFERLNITAEPASGGQGASSTEAVPPAPVPLTERHSVTA